MHSGPVAGCPVFSRGRVSRNNPERPPAEARFLVYLL
jgi:hypothetical protein